MHRHLLLIASAAVLASCGEQKSGAPATTEPPAEATASSQPTPPAAPAAAGEIADEQARLTLAALAAPYNTADLANGRATFARCRACHTLTEGGPRLTGPNLWGLVGRQVGSKEGFTYSPAMQAADFAWDTARLERWLDNPQQFLPGNRMIFPGIHDADDRLDLIAYIATQTRAPPAP
jgi:cytochrome c